MGLFQKRPDIGNSRPAYTLGVHKTLLIVGLGNVGKNYQATRHNIGFACVDSLAEAMGFEPWTTKKDLKCQLTTKLIGDNRVMLCKPTTLMNLSGEATQAVAQFYKLPNDCIVVVHDDIDVAFGNIRTRNGGGSAGHNGIKSVSERIGEDYGRVRVGIGPKTPEQIDSADFVLANFNKVEQQQIKNLFQETNAILTEYIHGTTLATETRHFIV